ncbi:hypothetical protein HacjB3_19598 (plasmid) [Halalkalicoccus jeotgali B3]|uniref:Uncharacterized protein n=1 Tax=Halalkalicoccus jeotgali (strain DSM 18796 / CECT 7217 / JCM 14584 / KCTC 4019 / B3) TaxID=795797 RepID=D8JDA2_HALJB|nr:hypothetical protein HacjB3_19598 [Halalkalicoccus jeotgali B3]
MILDSLLQNFMMRSCLMRNSAAPISIERSSKALISLVRTLLSTLLVGLTILAQSSMILTYFMRIFVVLNSLTWCFATRISLEVIILTLTLEMLILVMQHFIMRFSHALIVAERHLPMLYFMRRFLQMLGLTRKRHSMIQAFLDQWLSMKKTHMLWKDCPWILIH